MPHSAPAPLLVEMFAKRMQDPVAPPIPEVVAPVETEPSSPPAAPRAMEPISLPEGMEMVETRNGGAQGGAPADETPAADPPRRSRSRPAASVVLPDEPMQQVETRK